MAQTKKKRRRKHRGTPAGTVDRTGRTGRTSTHKDAKQISKQRRLERLDRKPTWRGATIRAAIAAVVFGVLVVLAFGRALAEGLALALFMFVLYIPLGYMTDTAIFRFRRRRRG
jgi:hypothetical protein